MTQTAQDPPRPSARSTTPAGSGWIAFACLMLFLVGMVNVIGGIAAIDGSDFYAGGDRFILAGLETFGWVLLILGILQMLAPIGIRADSFPAVWLGIGTAGINMVAHLLLMPAQPFWSLAIVALDILVIYGLINYSEAL